MSQVTVITGCPVFDGAVMRENVALIVADGLVRQIVDRSDIPAKADVVELDDGVLAPGFVDLQVNGGGGCLFNDNPGVESIETICAAHARLGTTSLLVTLITDTAEKTRAAIEAAITAQVENVPGFLGLHLEGPHLSQARKGAHDAALIRPMSDSDLHVLLDAAQKLNHLMITLAPESATAEQISALTAAGAVISLGHTDTSFETACAAARAGATCVTHLFNAMSPINHREPGMVGAALACGELNAGLIADGIHVHAGAIRIALAAKNGPGRIFLVSDAMSVTGTDLDSFMLEGRKILRRDGALRLEDGTLAGADLDLGSAVRFMTGTIGTGPGETLAMASSIPASCVGAAPLVGNLREGSRADIVHLDAGMRVDRVWQAGQALA